MAFLYPAFLLGALAIALPIVLHLLRRDVAPEVPFSAVRLLRRSPIDRSRRRRLRDLVLLAARIAALLLLAVAFARPYVARSEATPPMLIVAIDRSFSMGPPGRFARALEIAGDAIDGAAAGERVAVVAFDERADVVAQPGGRGDARAALVGLQTGYGATRYGPALARAVELAAGSPARVMVITDLQRLGWENETPVTVPAHVQIELADVAAPESNAAVTAVRVEPERLVATVDNRSDAEVASTARVTLDGREVASAPIRLAAKTATDAAIAYRAPGQGTLAVSVDDPEGYSADNIRYVLLDPLPRAHVLVLATAGAASSGLYLMRAIEAAEHEPFDARIVSGPELSAMTAPDLAKHAAVAVLSTRGLDRAGRDLLGRYLYDGGGVFIAAGADIDFSMLAPALGWSEVAGARQTDGPGLALAVSDVRHPVFRPFGTFAANLGQVRFERGWRLPAGDTEVAARFTDGSPALVERRHGSGTALIFASDLDRRWNAFPLHTGFVPFVIESIRHVANTREGVRDYLVGDAPPGAGPAPGVYKIRDGTSVAINVDAAESVSARLSRDEFDQMLVRAPTAATSGAQAGEARARTVEAQQNLWQYGLVLMLAVLAAEAFVGKT